MNLHFIQSGFSKSRRAGADASALDQHLGALNSAGSLAELTKERSQFVVHEGPISRKVVSLSSHIASCSNEIVVDWAEFVRKTLPSARAVTDDELRSHGRAILMAICEQMKTQPLESDEPGQPPAVGYTQGDELKLAEAHGALAPGAGCDLVQLVAEFRAMRACVLARWRQARVWETETAHAREEFAKFNEGIDQALAESVDGHAKTFDASRDMFLAVLGHDLRGPLAGISMSNMLISHPDSSEESRRIASARIDRATKTMAGLINDLIDFTRTRLGAGIPIHAARCQLRVVCEEAVEAARAANPSCDFLLTVDSELSLLGDVPRLHQALSNLLSNAVQHGERAGPVIVKAFDDGQQAVIAITNLGLPIPASAIGSIFEPMVQACQPSADARECSRTSMGLGLFIVREIIRGHGGEISVVSAAATGTTFTIRLPCLAGDGAARVQ